MKGLLDKLKGSIFGLFLILWLFCVFVGNYHSLFALLDGEKTVYLPQCEEQSYDGAYCEEYGEGELVDIKDNFVNSLGTATLITGGIAILFLIRIGISKIKDSLAR